MKATRPINDITFSVLSNNSTSDPVSNLVFTHLFKNLIKNSKGQFPKEKEAKFPKEKEKELLRVKGAEMVS